MIKKGCLVLLVCVALLSIGCSRKEEVVYQGKPLSEWMKMLEDTNPGTRMAAIHAVGKIGPEAREAIPLLLDSVVS